MSTTRKRTKWLPAPHLLCIKPTPRPVPAVHARCQFCKTLFRMMPTCPLYDSARELDRLYYLNRYQCPLCAYAWLSSGYGVFWHTIYAQCQAFEQAWERDALIARAHDHDRRMAKKFTAGVPVWKQVQIVGDQ